MLLKISKLTITNEQWKKGPWLYRVFRDEILPMQVYRDYFIHHYKESRHKISRIPWNVRDPVFF